MKQINAGNIHEIKQQINEIYEFHEQVLYKLDQNDIEKFFYSLDLYEQEGCFMIEDPEIIKDISKLIGGII